jgi:hypothetical protein
MIARFVYHVNIINVLVLVSADETGRSNKHSVKHRKQRIKAIMAVGRVKAAGAGSAKLDQSQKPHVRNRHVGHPNSAGARSPGRLT